MTHLDPSIYRIVAHGGAGSEPDHADGTEAAAKMARNELRRGADVLTAACRAVVVLEDDPRFNAGTGSSLRFDGATIQMDAACMDSLGTLGAVAVIEGVRNPVLVAREVARTPHVLLAGEGATAFARKRGFASYDPTTRLAQGKFARVREFLDGKRPDASGFGWKREDVLSAWNFERPPGAAMQTSDTVGCVVSDGHNFAAALSTGGPTMALRGRVGDVPLPGCGLFAGEAGAVACTGRGEAIAKQLLASRVYRLMDGGSTAARAVAEGLSWFSNEIDVGIIAVGRSDASGGSNRSMAWASLDG